MVSIEIAIFESISRVLLPFVMKISISIDSNINRVVAEVLGSRPYCIAARDPDVN
jgi:hypothetical protein